MAVLHEVIRIGVFMRAGWQTFAAALGGAVLVSGAAAAGPWTSLGDAPLRSDIELLASAGVVDNIAMHWPLPWAGLLDSLETPSALAGQPDYVVEAADRVRGRGKAETRADTFHISVLLDTTGSPATVRGYDALGRQSLQAQASLEYIWRNTVVHLDLGAQSVDCYDHQVFVPDGSYIAQRLGDTVVYAGYLSHWWGPGWISALSVSTNARPVPQIGISRVSTAPFESPWLRWLGPWQLEFFVGVLDGPRIARNTIYNGLRFAFSPIQHLEIGLMRADMMCGKGHSCKPLTYFDPRNDPAHTDSTNDQASIDFRYTNAMDGLNYALYMQLMNEDSSPFTHSGTSHLYGGSVWFPVSWGITRLTAEYTDTVPTGDMFGGGVMHGFAYNNWDYVDGMRYRGRTLGFSLDSDSRLISFQATLTDHADRSLAVTYHHAWISDPLNGWGNVVTSAPVELNEGQIRLSFPLEFDAQKVHFDIEGRLQDDQPRPSRGYLATVEAALRVTL